MIRSKYETWKPMLELNKTICHAVRNGRCSSVQRAVKLERVGAQEVL
jgi:hypothetical protein